MICGFSDLVNIVSCVAVIIHKEIIRKSKSLNNQDATLDCSALYEVKLYLRNNLRLDFQGIDML